MESPIRKLTSLFKLRKRPSIMFSIIYYLKVLMTRRMRRRTSVARERMKVSNRESSSSSPISFDPQFLRTFFTNSSMLNYIPCWFSLKAAACRSASTRFLLRFLVSSHVVKFDTQNLQLLNCMCVYIMTRRYMCIWWPATYNYPVFCLLLNPIYSRLEPPMCFPLFVRPFVSRLYALWLWAL